MPGCLRQLLGSFWVLRRYNGTAMPLSGVLQVHYNAFCGLCQSPKTSPIHSLTCRRQFAPLERQFWPVGRRFRPVGRQRWPRSGGSMAAGRFLAPAGLPPPACPGLHYPGALVLQRYGTGVGRRMSSHSSLTRVLGLPSAYLASSVWYSSLAAASASSALCVE
jgi:hypothetical protein